MHQFRDFYKAVLSSICLFFILSIPAVAGQVDDLQNTINSNAANKVTTTLSKDYDGFVNSVNLLPANIATGGENGNTSGFSTAGKVTISSTTTSPYQGSYCIKVQPSATYSGIKYNKVTLGSTEYTYSVYLKGSNGGEQISMRMDDNGGYINSTSINLTNSWIRYNVTGTTHSNGTTLQLKVQTPTNATAVTFFYDAAQLETGSSVTEWDYSRLGSFVAMPSNTIIEGSGYNLKNVSLIAVNASNISINNTVFKDTVYPYTKSNTFSPINISGIGNNIAISNCSFSNLRAGSAGIYLQPIALSDIVLKDISINDTDNSGIATMSNDVSAINNAIYLNISVSHCGYNSHADDWVVGILLGEIIEHPTHDWRQLHLSNITVENCSAEYSWESGFHLEPNINTNNVTIKNCVSSHNGVKPVPSYGAGFVTASAATLLNNVATSNYIGYWFYNGIKVTDQTDDFVYNVENCTDIDSVTEGTHIYGYTTAYASSQLNFTNCLSKNAGSFGFHGYQLFNLHLTNETIINPHGDGNNSVCFSKLHNSTINMNYLNNDTFSSNGIWVGMSDNVNISGNYYHIVGTALHLQWNDQKINTINITDANISATQHAIWISDMGANATTNISYITVIGEFSGKKVMYNGTAAGVVNVFWKTNTGVTLSDYYNSILIPSFIAVLSSDDNIIVNVIKDESGDVIWSESSSIATTETRHIIAGFSPNSTIQITRDGINYAVVQSNETGFINWTYSGGYYEHLFEARMATAGEQIKNNNYSKIVDTLGAIIGSMGIIIFLVIGIVYGMQNGKFSLKTGMSFIKVGGAIVIIVGLITYMISIIL